MSPFQDGWLSALAKIVTAIQARSTDIDYRALYGGVVLFRDGDKVTVRPDNEDLGDSLVCQLRRPDGYSSEPAPGTACLIGWDGYDPSERYAVMAATSGQAATSVTIQAATVNLGDEQGQTLSKAALASAMQAFAFACTASTDVTLVNAAKDLNTALTGLPLAPVGTPLLSTIVTSKTKAS